MKTKRYWLRGGLLGLIIGVVMMYVVVALAYKYDCPTDCSPYWFDIISWASGWLFFVAYKSGLSRLLGVTVYWIFVPITYFMYGTVIGGIYGKVKNRQRGTTVIKAKRYWLRGIIFGLILAIFLLIATELFNLGIVMNTPYYIWLFSYTVLGSLIIFTLAGIIFRKNLLPIVKGLIMGIIIYITFVLPVLISEMFYCQKLYELEASEAICGIFSATAIIVFIPFIVFSPIVGWIYSKIKNRKKTQNML